MRNSEVSRILRVISIYEDMNGDFFKARAYERAAREIDSLTEELSEIYKRGGIEALMEIPGVGQAIAEKTEDLLTTGKTAHLEKLKKKVPVDVENLSALEGVGPKTIKTLWKKLKIKTVPQLEKAARAKRIRRLSGFGEKSELDILRSIEFQKKHSGRFLIGEVLPALENIRNRLEKVPGVKKVIIGGSARRMKETIGDADFLAATTDAKKIMDFFEKMPEVIHVYSRGKAKVLVKLESGMDADLEVVEEKSFGAAAQYFTGNKDHNVQLRRIAIAKGWKLNEYGIFKGEKYLFGKTEEEVYRKLGMDWVPPEMRENNGEIELAKKGKLPKLVPYGSLKGDLHTHSKWTDGSSTIEEMARAAKSAGLEYIAVTDHSKRMAFTGGLDEKKLVRQAKEIDYVNVKVSGIKVLKGIEVDILRDGRLDLRDGALKKLDVVGASIHSNFNLPRREQTKRLIKVVENPHVDILFHPTSREIQRREPCDFDMEAVFDAAKSNGTILEIDSTPGRLDLKDDHVRLARKIGCKFSVDSDAHSPKHFEFLKIGLGQARRGWLEKKDIINTQPIGKFLKSLK